MAQTLVRYNKRSVQHMIGQIDEWIIQSNDSLVYEESRDYPNEERLDLLNDRIDSLQRALDALDEIV